MMSFYSLADFTSTKGLLLLVGISYFIYTSSSITVSPTASMSPVKNAYDYYTLHRYFHSHDHKTRVLHCLKFGYIGINAIPFLTINNLVICLCFFQDDPLLQGRSNFLTIPLDELLQDGVKSFHFQLGMESGCEEDSLRRFSSKWPFRRYAISTSLLLPLTSLEILSNSAAKLSKCCNT